MPSRAMMLRGESDTSVLRSEIERAMLKGETERATLRGVSETESDAESSFSGKVLGFLKYE